MFVTLTSKFRYPDEEAGQIPMAYIVRTPGSKINEAQIMEIIAKKACPLCTIVSSFEKHLMIIPQLNTKIIHIIEKNV